MEGWAKPVNSRKFHYFRGLRSLCMKWMFFASDLDDDYEQINLPDDCKACLKKRQAERAVADKASATQGKDK